MQESVDLMYEAFDISERYRCIVEIMTDSGLGQMMEPCDMPAFREIKKCDWGLDGTYKVRRPDFLGRNIPAESETYMQKVRLMRENEQRWVSTDVEDADYVFVAFGMCGRVMTGLIGELRKKGYKVGLIRPISAWPFPEKAFEELKAKNPNVKGFITVETNGEGQMAEDVAIYTRKHGLGAAPIYALAYACGVPKDDVVTADFEKILAGEIKEVF